jgi:hypothetical protein
MTFGEETAEDKSRWTEHKLVVVLLRKAIDIKEQDTTNASAKTNVMWKHRKTTHQIKSI